MPHARTSKPIRRLVVGFRLILLAGLVGLSLQLLRWNRQVDPRFFLFLRTPPGKVLARVMNWPNLHNPLDPDRPLDAYTEEERVWHQKLTATLEDTWPTHTVVFHDESRRHLRILATDSTRLQVLETYGARGRLESHLDRDRIRSILPYPEPAPRVTWRDVRFQMTHPTFDLNYAGPYTVLTDAPYYQVASSVETLAELRRQYLEIFSPLVRFPKTDLPLQLLYFTREDEYRRHQQEVAPELSRSLGFYSPLEDRMVMFNHQNSEHVDKIRGQMNAELRELRQRARTGVERARLRRLQEDLEDRIRDQAHRETVATLRHEGAHHLSYTYGVHSWIHTENAWLIEGLATYFESAIPGDTVSTYAHTLRELIHQNRVPALANLLAVRMPDAFATDLPGLKAHEAYALSWSVFRLCMRPRHREGFFRYLRELQDPVDISALVNTPRIERLAAALDLSPRDLESEWRATL